MSRYKRLDTLVNNAGVLRDRLIGMIPDAEMEEVFDVNVFGLLRLTQVASRFMTRRKSGSIINVASIVGRRGNVGEFVYAASKAAVIGATLSAAKEFAPMNIRVNAVAPGLIETAMMQHFPENNRRRIESSIAMGGIGTPDDVARTILFLASDLSALRYRSGHRRGRRHRHLNGPSCGEAERESQLRSRKAPGRERWSPPCRGRGVSPIRAVSAIFGRLSSARPCLGRGNR